MDIEHLWLCIFAQCGLPGGVFTADIPYLSHLMRSGILFFLSLKKSRSMFCSDVSASSMAATSMRLERSRNKTCFTIA